MSVFFSPRKIVLKSWLDTSSIASYLLRFLSFFLSQSCQHLDTLWIDRESFWPFDNFSTLDGSIEPHFLLLVFLFLDSFSTHDLSTLFFFFYTYSTDVSTLPRHLICRDLLRVLFKLLVQSACHFSISFSIDLCFLSQTLSSLPQIFSTRFLQASPSFSSLGKLLFSCITWFMFLKPWFWDFFKKIWGFLKIDEILLKFWVSFWRFDLKNFMHCITFAL